MKRLLPFIILIILFIGGILALPFLVRPEKYRATIIDTLSKIFKKPVLVGDISMKYFPPALRVSQIAVMKENNEVILQVTNSLTALEWTALFQLKVVPKTVELDHWTLTTNRMADGRWDIEGMLSDSKELSGTKTWSISEIRWKQGEVHWVDRFASVPQELVLAEMEGRWDLKRGAMKTSGAFSTIGTPARFSFSGQGQFFSTPQWSGELQVTDSPNALTLQISQQAGTLDIRGGASQWRFAQALSLAKFYGRGDAARVGDPQVMLASWQVHIKEEAKKISLEQTATISGGISEMKGRLEPTAAGIAAHLEGACKGVPTEVLWGFLGESISLKGQVTGIAKNIEFVLSPQTISTLSGQGYWEITSGRYIMPPVSMQKLAKAKTMAYLNKKYPDLGGSGIPLTKLSAHWSFKKGMVEIDDGALVSTDIRGGWVGMLDLARHGMDGYLRLQIREKDPALASLVPVKYRTEPAHGRLQGTWNEWSLRAISSSKIPAAVKAKLHKAVNQ